MCKVEGCELPIIAQGLCSKHYYRWKRNGHWNLLTKPTLKEKLLGSVSINKITDCWEWQKSLYGGGYGHTYEKGTHFGAHRASWICFKGEIPDGLHVCHKCDNKVCINPEHLFLGTATENLRDAMNKGRLARGSRNGRSKLPEEAIRDIRSRNESRAEYARKYNVSQCHVNKILRGDSWAWL